MDDLDEANQLLQERYIALEKIEHSFPRRMQNAANFCCCNLSCLCTPLRCISGFVIFALDMVGYVCGYRVQGR